MSGDERSRFCESCKLNVYNFSEMSESEIKHFIVQKEDRICGKLYKRADGSVITKDCPTGLRAVRKRVTRVTSAVFATIIGLSAITFGQTDKEKSCKIISQGKVTRFESKSELINAKGVVKDLAGASIPNAKILLVNLETKKEFSAKTNDDGGFKLKNLPEGTYKATFTAEYFKDYKVEKLQLTKNETLEFVISLRPSQETVTIGIISEESLIDTTSSTFKTVITQKMIENLPHKK